jgi:hypothetical protein
MLVGSFPQSTRRAEQREFGASSSADKRQPQLHGA